MHAQQMSHLPPAQVEGTFEAILPREDLEAVHSRILASELVVKESGGGGLSSSAQQGRYDANVPPLNVRLAAALGLSPLLLPFRCEALLASQPQTFYCILDGITLLEISLS